jgi:hypothetical protein
MKLNVSCTRYLELQATAYVKFAGADSRKRGFIRMLVHVQIRPGFFNSMRDFVLASHGEVCPVRLSSERHLFSRVKHPGTRHNAFLAPRVFIPSEFGKLGVHFRNY